MFKAIKKMLKEASTLPNKSIVYLNICIRVLDLNFKIGYYLDADDDTNQHEVIVVHGQWSKIEKIRHTKFFLNLEHPGDENITVLCSTSGVGDVSLDYPHIRNVFRLEPPPPPWVLCKR